MKLISIGTTILSLENVQRVDLERFGSGAKSNPFRWVLTVTYTNLNRESLDTEKELTAQNWYQTILSILQGD